MVMKKEQGFVSIIVASVLMILLSLITIGFSRYMQREQRQALDRQLSTQAFYAAETAVNDVYQAISDGTPIPEEKTLCDTTDWPTVGADGTIDAGRPEIVYTCLTYDQTPTNLVFTDSITTEGSKIFPVQPKVAGDTVQTITLSWNGELGSTTVDPSQDSCVTSPDVLPASFAAGSIPMLRLDIIEAPTGGFDREQLINRTASMYLYPKTCGVSAPTNVAFTDHIGPLKGNIVNINCSGGSGCETTIDNLGADRYYVRVRSVYTNAETMTVEATSSGPIFEFKNAQTVVDATGKSNDVLRRIETRISNAPDYRVPEAVIESSGICKLIEIAPAAPATSSVIQNADCY